MGGTDAKIGDRKSRRPSRLKLILAVCGLAALGVAGLSLKYGHMVSSKVANTERDEEARAASGVRWAERLDVPGLPNLHRVSDTLYRGARPEEKGLENLGEMGIKTIVNLRLLHHSDKKQAAQLNLAYEVIPVETWDPDSYEVVRFLEIATDSNCAPVFVHCKHGADRTGTMCAIYRIIVEGWTKEQAIAEMTAGGFHFHSTWKNLIKYINDLDVQEIERRAGLTE